MTNDLQSLKAQAEMRIYQHYDPNLKKGINICPFHEDTKNSKSFSIYSGDDGDMRWSCKGACNTGGDCIDFIAKHEHCSNADAIGKFHEIMGSNNSNKSSSNKNTNKTKPQTENPKTIESIKKITYPKGFKYNRHHIYTTGKPTYLKVILKDSTGDKMALFYHAVNTDCTQWILGRGEKSIPVLYNDNVLEGNIFDVCYPEGEKDVDTLKDLGYIAVTAGSKNDFKPEMAAAFKDRNVILFPDNDPDGTHSMKDIAALLQDVARSVKVVNIPAMWQKHFKSEMPIKADISDYCQMFHEFFNEPEYGDDKLCMTIGEMITEATPAGLPEIPKGINAVDLMKLEIPPLRFIISKILPVGLTMFAGKPKIGKSFLMFNLAISAASGGKALGSIQVDKIKVTYLALEDGNRRLKDRLEKIINGDNVPKNLEFFTKWQKLNEGGLIDLDNYLKYSPDTKLIIIDTLAKVRSQSKSKNPNVYYEDSDVIGELKKIADKYEVAIVIVHHTRKAIAEDIFDTVSGSTGLTGAADTSLILHKNRNNPDATLSITGRDIEEQELALTFDQDIFTWRLLGTAAEFKMSNERHEILQVLKNSKESLKPSEISKSLNNKNVNVISKHIAELLKDNLISKAEYGKYIYIINQEW
jgi:DNA-binding transcriptional ArsR family regulator